MENGFIMLETERLLLRDHVPDDLPSHHALLSDAKAMVYLPDLKTESLEQSKANLSEALSEIGAEARTKFFLRIEKKDTKEHVGEIGYTVTDFAPAGKLVHLGYFLRPECWGMGFATEAAREVLRFAFEENAVFRVSTGCITENAASERVMRKCGMIKEALHRQREWHDGKLKDRVEYRLLREEFLQIHPKK